MDKWIFWTIPGWKWSVWRGARVVGQGYCASEVEANAAADEFMAK